MHDVTLDPGKLEIIRNAFTSIAMEMKMVLSRSAFSSTIQEANDFSIGVFEKDRLIGMADTIMAHVGTQRSRIRGMLRRFPLEQLENGDVILMNDPYYGGTHTPDVTVIKVIRRDDLIFLPIAFGHWSDVGGMTPGSISGGAVELYQEGLVIPPIKLYKKGEYNEAVMDLLLNNVRLPELRAGDTRTQVAACDLAEIRIDELLDRFGVRYLKLAIEEIIAMAEARCRARIAQIPDGTYEFEDYIDGDGQTPEPLRIHVKVTKSGTDLVFDFTGSSKQAAGPTNVNISVVESAVCAGFKAMVDPAWSLNEGFYRPLKIIVPEGTFLNARKPAPTGSCWEIWCRVVDTLIGALVDVVPIKAAGPNGSVSHMFIGGFHPKTGQPYVWYEYPQGGMGGTDKNDGCSSVISLVGGDTRDYPIERAEAEFPLLCTLYAERIDSGGPGKWRGGKGLVRNMVVLDDERYQKIGLSLIWDRARVPTLGVGGGYSGAPQRCVIRRAAGEIEEITVDYSIKVSAYPVHLGDTISARMGGGAGYGDPLDRDPVLVLQDVLFDHVTLEAARDIYGVIIDEHTRRVDGEATEKQRKRIRDSRIYVTVAEKNEEFIGNRRIARVHPRTLSLLNLRSDDCLIELVGKRMAALRLWAITDEKCNEFTIAIDKAAMDMCGVTQGEKVWLRDPLWSKRYVLEKENERYFDKNVINAITPLLRSSS